MAFVIMAVICSFMGYILGYASGSENSSDWYKKYINKVPRFSEKQYVSIANRLGIEADGGDSPADFVKWAIEEETK